MAEKKKSTKKTTAKAKPAKKSSRSAKAAKSNVAHKPRKAARPVRKEKAVVEESSTAVQAAGHQGKIQCLNARNKTVCAHLVMEWHKCNAKTIGHGKLATVRIGKKRRCEFYEETSLTA